MPRAGVPLGMTPPKSEKLILQAELRRAWGVVDCLIGVVAMCLGLVDSLRDRLAQKTMENDDLKKEVASLKRMLSVHESWNHSSRETVLFAKKRKEFQRMADGGTCRAEGGSSSSSSARPAGRRRGHQSGTKGVSHACKPTGTRTYRADTCKNCGRTDTQPEGAFWKVVLDLPRCGNGMAVCHVEETVPAYCIGCGTVTRPETGTIAGSSLGPGLRRIITNIHAVVPSVRSIQKLLASNHGVTLSTGCISNCLSGTAGRAKGNRPETAPDHAEIPLVSKAPLLLLPPSADHGPYDVSRDAVWSGTIAAAAAAAAAAAQPLLWQIEEKISMAPCVQIDESRKNVGGRQAQGMVLDTEHAALIRIRQDKSRKTMESVFWMVLGRPFVADMYRGGNAFGREFQSCFVHVNRKSEGLAIRHGTGSFEYVLYVMMRRIYHDAKAAAARTLEMAGEPARSACDIGTAVRTVPGLAEHVESSRSALLRRLQKVAHAYRNGAVSDDDSRKFADTLENAIPHLLTFIGHPGMEGSTNACERTIRGYVVRPRNIQRILPNWRAADNLATLQTIHATCAKRGIFSGDAVTACDSWNMFEAGTPPPIFQNLK